MVVTHVHDDFAEMLKRYDRAMNRLVNGDPEPIKALYSHGDETSQCGAWGGVERGWGEVNARWDWVAAQFIPGESTLKQEIVLTSVTAEMAYAVFIERSTAKRPCAFLLEKTPQSEGTGSRGPTHPARPHGRRRPNRESSGALGGPTSVGLSARARS